MNKQKLIEKYEEKYETIFGFPVIQLNQILEDLKQLDEPQKPVIPQFVADLIEEARIYEWDLDDLFEQISQYSGSSEVSIWFYTLGNIDVLARAWLDGYEVENEKRYLVKIKGLDIDEAFLKFQLDDEYWYMGIAGEYKHARGRHTREELESAGFGWVFDSPGVEIDEVEE